MVTLIQPPTQYITDNTQFYFLNNNNQWASLPEWGNFLINIGSNIVKSQIGEERFVVGLAIPTRSYAAALVALGVVLAKSVTPINSTTSKEHFERLCKLKQGTRVFYKDINGWSNAIFDGVCNDYDRPLIRVRTRNLARRMKKKEPDLIYFICKEKSQRIKFAPSYPEIQLGKPLINQESPNNCLGSADAPNFCTTTQLDCVILGHIGILKHEITKIPFAYSLLGYKFKEGTLQDILRVRRFMSRGEPYRSEILPVCEQKEPKAAEVLISNITIFDGASSFIKWRDYWRNSHWIILLDRTETRFENAVNIINQEYSYRICEGGMQEIPLIPPGVEIVVYQEARQ